jgi:hypothetical protein
VADASKGASRISAGASRTAAAACAFKKNVSSTSDGAAADGSDGGASRISAGAAGAACTSDGGVLHVLLTAVLACTSDGGTSSSGSAVSGGVGGPVTGCVAVAYAGLDAGIVPR